MAASQHVGGLTPEQQDLVLSYIPLAMWVAKVRFGVNRAVRLSDEEKSQVYMSLVEAVYRFDPELCPPSAATDLLARRITFCVRTGLIDLYRQKKKHKMRSISSRFDLQYIDPSTIDQDEEFESLVSRFSERTQYLLRSVFRDGRLLKDVAKEFGVSAPRALQIKQDALESLRWRLSGRQR